MRKRVQRTVAWECRLCTEEHPRKRDTRACEQRGIIAPRFRLGQRVLAGYGFLDEWTGIVCGIAIESLWPRRHDGRLVYVICLDRLLGDGYLHLFTADELQAIPLDAAAPAVASVPDWNAFWKAFGSRNRNARRAVLAHLRSRRVLLKACSTLGKPKLRP